MDTSSSQSYFQPIIEPPGSRLFRFFPSQNPSDPNWDYPVHQNPDISCPSQDCSEWSLSTNNRGANYTLGDTSSMKDEDEIWPLSQFSLENKKAITDYSIDEISGNNVTPTKEPIIQTEKSKAMSGSSALKENLRRSSRIRKVVNCKDVSRRKPKNSIRSKHGCWTCRLRRKKCPEDGDQCSACLRLGIECDSSLQSKPEYLICKAAGREKMRQIKKITRSKKQS
ncbi:BA75_04857T0 [Komagataella pastoris]|uniref:BA75_04857T0 n=1 Tax=Komagataella pastoris TaxID=4922 RepID=A0A1B2JGY4_PICPA|nr:BA75_04857T0 [Komagataella pastoris]